MEQKLGGKIVEAHSVGIFWNQLRSDKQWHCGSQ